MSRLYEICDYIFVQCFKHRLKTIFSLKHSSISQKTNQKSSKDHKKSTRSNSTLTSKEVEFQNWKRRKSYDPMKAAAEGRKKLIDSTKKHHSTEDGSGQ